MASNQSEISNPPPNFTQVVRCIRLTNHEYHISLMLPYCVYGCTCGNWMIFDMLLIFALIEGKKIPISKEFPQTCCWIEIFQNINTELISLENSWFYLSKNKFFYYYSAALKQLHILSLRFKIKFIYFFNSRILSNYRHVFLFIKSIGWQTITGWTARTEFVLNEKFFSLK